MTSAKSRTRNTTPAPLPSIKTMDLSMIHSLLECSVCFEQLRDRSKVLPCQHTFCRSCLENCFITRGYLQCPECRLEYRGASVDSLPPNVFLERIVNELVKKEDKESSNPTLWKWEGLGTNKYQPCAKALHHFTGKEEEDLSFAKGDIILLSDILDENWYEGVLDGKTGVVPANFVEVLVPFPTFDDVSRQDPLARALYDFDQEEDDDVICFKKGDVIKVVKKIDINWCEGVFQDQNGIFPLNYVELNAAAEVLVTASDSSDEEDDYVENTQPRSNSPKAEIPKRHSIHVDNPEEQRIQRSQQFLGYSATSSRNRGRRASETSLLEDSVAQFTARTTSSSNNLADMPSSGATAPNRRSCTQTNENATGRETQGEACARMTPFQPTCNMFVCTYNYKPKKPDELTLIRGEIYCVTERYRDGWCKGYCARSNSKVPGMIPGNYLKPASNHHIQLSRSLSHNQTSQMAPPSFLTPLTVAVPYHGHSSSAPASMMQATRRHALPNRPAATQMTSGRTRSGSEPMDPANAARGAERSRLGIGSLIRKLKKKPSRPAPLPPPYASIPTSSFRVQRPVPVLPAEPPPPYTPPVRQQQQLQQQQQQQPLRSPTVDVAPSQLQTYDRFMAIHGFPPQTALELELRVGDVVYVIKRREDGWYHGISQRTRKVGLFPASFVEKV